MFLPNDSRLNGKKTAKKFWENIHLTVDIFSGCHDKVATTSLRLLAACGSCMKGYHCLLLCEAESLLMTDEAVIMAP